MKFSFKIGLSIVGALVVSLALMSSLFYYTTSRALESELEERAKDNAANIMDKLERFMFERMQDSKIIASSLPFKEAVLDLKKITLRLIDYRNDWRTYSSISFYDLSGKRLADTSGLMIGEVEKNRPFFKDAIANGISTGSEVDLSISDMAPTTYFSSIVKNRAGEAIGVIVTRVPLYRLRDILTETERFKIDLIDKDGRILYSTRAGSHAFKEHFSDEVVLGKMVANAKTGFTTMHQHEDGWSHYNAFAREDGYLDYKGNGWAIVLWVPDVFIAGPLKALKFEAGALFFLAVALSTLLAAYLSSELAKPLSKLAAAAKEIGRGRLDIKLDYTKKDEFGGLATTFREMAHELDVSDREVKNLVEELQTSQEELENYSRTLEEKVDERTKKLAENVVELKESKNVMLSLLEDTNEAKRKLEDTQARLVQAGKMAGIGQMAAGVAHEINNPLTSVLGFAQLMLMEDGLDEKMKADLRIIEKETKRCVGIIENLLNFARPLPIKKEAADLNRIIESTLQIVRYSLEREGIRVTLELDKSIKGILADEPRIKQVFLNIFLNAASAMPNGGTLYIETKDYKKGEVLASITDTGVGIPEDIRDKIFEPFFTTSYQQGRKGTGLGLSICYAIVKEHGGRLEFDSEVGKGTTFRVIMPTV